MCADSITTSVITAAVSETGKSAGAGIADKVGDVLSRAASIPVDKAIANRSAFADYLQNACASISRAKTILYRQPTSIESFFEPIDIVVRGNRLHTQASTEHVTDVLKLGSRLIIAGHAGAGKSIVMRHLFIDACRNEGYLPIYVELRAVNQAQEDTSIVDLIYQALRKYGVGFSRQDLIRNLDAQEFLFLLDGLDEVSELHMGRLKDDIQNLGTEHPRAKIIVSSRFSDDEFRSWENFVVANTVELNKTQAVSLINRLEFDDADAKELFASELENSLYEKHESFASNPLLLTMMLMVFSDQAAIPDDLTEFYSQTFDTLFRRHDAGKSGKFHRDLKCGFSDDDFKRVFSNFCFITFHKDEFSFTYDTLMARIRQAIRRVLGTENETDGIAYYRDLLESVCMLQLDGRRYAFVHRSFQEYFAAIYAIRLPSDDRLRDIVVTWLDNHPMTNASSDTYLSTMQKLNPDRFERQVVFEKLRELRNECKKSANPQFRYLEMLYRSIELGDFDNDRKSFGFLVKDKSYCVLVHMLRISQHIPWKEWSSIEQPGCEERILSYLESMPDTRATFDEIKESGLVDALLGCTDMGANGVFKVVDRLEAKYAQEDNASVLDCLYDL